MSNNEKYRKIFAEIFQLADDDIEGAKLNVTPQWDSVGQMSLVTSIEETFNIRFDFDDILNMDSFENGKDILKKYDVEI